MENHHFILEKWINFDYEVSIVVVEVFLRYQHFSVTLNINKGSNLLMSIAPAPIPEEIIHKVESTAKAMMRNFGLWVH